MWRKYAEMVPGLGKATPRIISYKAYLFLFMEHKFPDCPEADEDGKPEHAIDSKPDSAGGYFPEVANQGSHG